MASHNDLPLTNTSDNTNGGSTEKINRTSYEGSKDLPANEAHTTSNKCGCCRICCSKLYSCCKPCMTKYNPQPEGATRCQRFRHAFLCPPHGKLAKILTLILSLLLMWGTSVSLFGATALPGGNFFGIFVLFVLCLLGGELVKPMRMPPLLGRLM